MVCFKGSEEEYQKLITRLEHSAAAAVERYKEENNASNGETALAAISIYHTYTLAPPKWATDTIRETWEKFKTGIGDGWQGEPSPENIEFFLTFDEALGLKRRTKKAEIPKQEKDHLVYFVYGEVERLYNEEGYILDWSYGEIGQKVGEKFGISGSKAHQCYKVALERGFPPISKQPRRRKKSM